MRKILFVAVLAVAVAVPRHVMAQAQTTSARATLPTEASVKAAHLRTSKKHALLRHPTAAERHLSPADLVAVTGPRGEKRFVRKSSISR
jgi:hypothetical protein